MRAWAVLLLLVSAAAQAAVVRVPLRADATLAPQTSITVTVKSSQALEIGWEVLPATACHTDCIQATELSAPAPRSIATSMGASQIYTPGNGIVSVQYTNVSTAPVSIRVYQVKRSCEAQSCQFLKAAAQGSWLVFKVREFKSLATSADGSYSTISGVAMSGRAFTVQAIWWSQEKPVIGVNCAPSIQRYLDSHAAPERYSPYVISGKGVGTGGQLVLNDIDTCAPNAPHFGVPEEHVFK